MTIINLKKAAEAGHGITGSLPTEIGLFRSDDRHVHEALSGRAADATSLSRVRLRPDRGMNARSAGVPTNSSLDALTGSACADGRRPARHAPHGLGKQSSRTASGSPRRRGRGSLRGPADGLGLLTKVEEFTLEGHRPTGPAPTGSACSNLQRGFSSRTPPLSPCLRSLEDFHGFRYVEYMTFFGRYCYFLSRAKVVCTLRFLPSRFVHFFSDPFRHWVE